MFSLTAIATADEAVARLSEIRWDEVPVEDLPAAVVELERVQARLDAAKLKAAERLERTEAAATVGWASTKDFLTAVSGGRKGAGGGVLRLVAALRELPRTQRGLADGWLSADKARVIGRRVGQLPAVEELRGAAEGLLLARARDLDATDLDHAWPAIVAELDPDHRLLGADLSLPRAERAAHRARFLSFSDDEFGGVWIKGYGSGEEVEQLKSVLMPLAAPVSGTPGACGGRRRDLTDPGDRGTPCPEQACAHDGRDPRDFGVRMWDALVEACRRLQTADLLPESHGATPRMVVTISLDDLQRDLDTSAGLLPGGRPLSARAARRIACDTELIPMVLGATGQVLDVGRTQRLVTTAIWHALVARDAHCVFPGCSRLPEACDAHHVVHWVDGGPTSLDNLALLCRRHHTTVHQTAWRLRIDPVTRRPAWSPPPRADDSGRYTFLVSPPYRAA
ncbi:HNH endonuclease signature motif containing protein [Nocardioides sp. URHA0032]|uniref:HNH endonuclease signature motif containing protein n=1 Tax=Nocardioides sp. URHA0032 TaxID=1380388 RepID=UPI00048AD554|nr:HNH endonuclease signature motif containing protein [Nocardioides sp. URHA0032]